MSKHSMNNIKHVLHAMVIVLLLTLLLLGGAAPYGQDDPNFLPLTPTPTPVAGTGAH